MTKMKTARGSLRTILLAGAAVALAFATPQAPRGIGALMPVAHAQSDSGHAGSQGGGGHAGQGGAASGTHGTESSHGTRSTHAPGTSGQDMGQGGSVGTRGHYGQGGSTGTETGEEGTSSDRQGPRFGGGENSRQPEAGTRGGRPAWAKEGIPAVELGRLSVARAPAQVLDHAFSEVISNWTTTTASTIITLTDGTQITVAQLYSMSAADFANIVATDYAAVTRIDSPLENLSLLKNLLSSGSTALTGVTPSSTDDLAAIFLGSASDKTIAISTDTVIAVNTILNLPPLTDQQVADIAAKAELVRDAILTGHGE